MALSSSPSLPSSFDPAVHLHPDSSEEPFLPHSDSRSDDLEALHEQTQANIIEKTKHGIVIQHRSWNLKDALRSDDIFNPETPTRVSASKDKALGHLRLSPREPIANAMPFSSSPVAYPPSSSPPAMLQKRKRPGIPRGSPKKRRMIGGFVDDEDSGSDLGDLNEDAEYQREVQKATQVERDAPPRLHSESSLHGLAATPPSKIEESGTAISGTELLRAKRGGMRVITSSGKHLSVPRRLRNAAQSYESIIASRSAAEAGKAQQSYYGIEIHRLIDDAKEEIKLASVDKLESGPDAPIPSIEAPRAGSGDDKKEYRKLWTEKYRAKKFTDLIGDERTHRQVLRWIKEWDSIVFPGSRVPKMKKKPFESPNHPQEDRQMRKILMLTGPPGLGKTTLAHVCAKQAGYEVLEINASDERSRDVVKGRIKDAVGTETVRGINTSVGGEQVRKAGKPVCVIVDEVDGVVSGSGGSGEGGFIKALIDLVQLDQRNSGKGAEIVYNDYNKKQKGDKFRQLRPLILICNDAYHPSLRPLRATSIAEVIHVRKPPLDKVISRLKMVFDNEGITCENDGIRRLCESTWGIGSRKQGQANSRGSGEGDMRGILVAGEWAAYKLRTTAKGSLPRLTRKWVEEQLLVGATGQGSNARGLGRGGIREVVDRVFLEGAGIPLNSNASAAPAPSGFSSTSVLGVADIRKRAAMNALREMIDTTGDHDRCTTDCFSQYPNQVYQDNTYLSKPNIAYEWLHFHDSLSSRVFGSQEWELTPYLPQATLAFHHLFAAVGRTTWDGDRPAEKEQDDGTQHPFSGLRADFAAYEALKHNNVVLTEFQSSFTPSLMRLFSSMDSVATELLPNLMRMTAPDVKPVVVGGSTGSTASVRKDVEKNCVVRSAHAMNALGIRFEKARVEFDGPGGNGGWIYRMEPPLDEVTSFHMGKTAGEATGPVRYAIRQVLDQELRKEAMRQRSASKQARFDHGRGTETIADAEMDKENTGKDAPIKQRIAAVSAIKRDFFGRIVNEVRPISKASELGKALTSGATKADEKRVWVSFNEGYSNAVRKPVTLLELMGSF